MSSCGGLTYEQRKPYVKLWSRPHDLEHAADTFSMLPIETLPSPSPYVLVGALLFQALGIALLWTDALSKR